MISKFDTTCACAFHVSMCEQRGCGVDKAFAHMSELKELSCGQMARGDAYDGSSQNMAVSGASRVEKWAIEISESGRQVVSNESFWGGIGMVDSGRCNASTSAFSVRLPLP